MKKINLAVLIGATTLFSAFTISNSINWKVSENYAVTFKGVEAEGIFKTMEANIVFDKANLANSNFKASLDVASINTGNGTKNKHAVSDKWLDADQFPKISFTSSKFTKTDAGYLVEGELDLHGVKKTITIPFTFLDNTFLGTIKVKRMDYGVGTMKGMSKKVGDDIEIALSVPVTKK